MIQIQVDVKGRRKKYEFSVHGIRITKHFEAYLLERILLRQRFSNRVELRNSIFRRRKTVLKIIHTTNEIRF